MINSSTLLSQWFIPGNVPSSKNSKRIVTHKTSGGTMVPFLIDSSVSMKYRKNYSIIYRSLKNGFLKATSNSGSPLYIGFYFVRESLRTFDLHNAVQIVADMMTAEGLIKDDNAGELVPVFLGYHKDAQSPGVYVRVLGEQYRHQMEVFQDYYKKQDKQINIKTYEKDN